MIEIKLFLKKKLIIINSEVGRLSISEFFFKNLFFVLKLLIRKVYSFKENFAVT